MEVSLYRTRQVESEGSEESQVFLEGAQIRQRRARSGKPGHLIKNDRDYGVREWVSEGTFWGSQVAVTMIQDMTMKVGNCQHSKDWGILSQGK